jgi:uncharacterized phage protein (TIGR01671 family)
MREIKFRAWDKYKSKMHYLTDSKTEIEFDSSVSFIPVMWECVVYDENGKIQEFFGSHERHDYDDYNWNFDETGNVLMQYTGLKDENGKEIYEGDLLADTGSDGNGGEIIYTLREVVFYEGAFQMKELLDKEWGLDYMDDITMLKVIGNIYMNPELLGNNGRD